MVQHERINFAISPELEQWCQQQPNVIGVTSGPNSATIDHNMTATQLTTFKNNFINMLSQTLPPT